MEYPVTFGEQFNLTYKLNIKTLFIPSGKDLSKQCRVFFAYRSYTRDVSMFSNLFSQMNKCIIDAGKKNGSLSQFYRDIKKWAIEREKRDDERRKQIAEFMNQIFADSDIIQATEQILPTRRPLLKRKEKSGSPLPGSSQDASSPASSKASNVSRDSEDSYISNSNGSLNLLK